MDVREAMKNQTHVAMILSGHVLSSAPKDSNVIFSPASTNSAITMHAAGPGGDLVSGQILSFLRSSSIDELKTVFRELASVVYADRSATGGPKITAANGLWIDKSLPTDPKFKDLFENFFKAVYVPVDFRSEVNFHFNISFISEKKNLGFGRKAEIYKITRVSIENIHTESYSEPNSSCFVLLQNLYLISMMRMSSSSKLDKIAFDKLICI